MGKRYRRCNVKGCHEPFETESGGRVNCDNHRYHGTGKWQTQDKARRERNNARKKTKKLASPCETCAHGVAEPAAVNGWACAAGLARECAPDLTVRRKVEKV